MRAYSKTASTFLLCVAGAALAGCFSAAVAPPAANAPCTSADGCAPGYQCRPATTGATGTFCCKDKSSCGPAGIDGSVRDATIGLDGAGGAGGIDVPAVDVGTDTPIGAGGSGGMATDTSTGGEFATGGISGAGGTGAGGVDAPTIDSGVDAPIATGGTPAAGGVTGTGGVGTGGGTTSATGGTIGTGGIGVGGSGSGGQVTCSGSTKLCNGSCIPSTSCCGGCSGNIPVCSNGTCVGRAIGDACSTSTECGTGVCADGVCCNVACNGQCESCSTASSKGTCAPTTTPRTACTGTGVCGGICDESATNRKTCVFPDDKTSCGASASCSAGKLNTAAVCNGSGTCNASSTSSCPYGCKTDGTIGCATSCPNGQGLCGGSCVDILSTASHCGGACQSCSGTTTPYCHSGSCVQCLTGADCAAYADRATCGPNYSCQCAVPTAGNLIQNGGFDTALGLTGWNASGNLTTFTSNDSDGCPTSGSVEFTVQDPNVGGLDQCVPVAANTTYNFGYSYVQQVANAIDCNLFFYVGTTTCSGQWSSVVFLTSDSSTGTGWYSASTSTTSPAGTGSVGVSCHLVGANYGPAGWLDQVYLSANANQY